MTTAFLYKWTHTPTSKWYVGSRTAKGCHPSDGYLCSSKIVKPMILENKKDWSRTVLVIGTPEYIRSLESAYLTMLDAKNDKNSFNSDNADGNFSFTGKTHSAETKIKLSKNIISDTHKSVLREKNLGKVLSPETRKKMSESRIGIKKKPLSAETRKKMSDAKKGKTRAPHSAETIEKLKIARQNRIITEETRQKISKACKGRIVSNDTKEKISKSMKLRFIGSIN